MYVCIVKFAVSNYDATRYNRVAASPEYILKFTCGYGKNLTHDSARMYLDGHDTIWRTNYKGIPLDTNKRYRVSCYAYDWESL